MRKTLLILSLFSLLALNLQAQDDSIPSNRYVMRSTLYGAGFTNLLETYLSPAEYKGPEIRIMRESMRFTKLIDGHVSTQSLFQAQGSITHNKADNSNQYSLLANWNYSWHYQFPFNENLKLLAGPMVELNGGMTYLIRNSNNPVQVKAYMNIGASGMAIYRFHIKEFPMVVRYQLNIPLAGLYFSPKFGQSYYQMSEEGDWYRNFNFTSIHNQPSLRQLLTLDIPIHSTNLRIGYLCDIQQAKLNHLKSHSWSNTFLIGLVKNFYLIKGKNKVSMPASVSPF